jgi:hypothetical protein
VKIEILYIDGCPNVPATVERVKKVLSEHGLDWAVGENKVGDHHTAIATKFLGSPTVRINDLDIEPSGRSRIDFGIMCRTYGGNAGVPPEDLIRGAIAEARTIFSE